MPNLTPLPPFAAVCCLCTQGHGPCGCHDWKRWQRKLQEEMQLAGANAGAGRYGQRPS